MTGSSTLIEDEGRAVGSGSPDNAGASAAALPASEADWPSRRYAWTALILLMAGGIVSVLDRSIIQLLVEPIKAAYGLSDTQFGALQSIAFGLFYTTMAIPIGMLADRFPRKIVIGIGIATFSLFAAFTGLARNYTQLFIARFGVGVGEASLHPSAYSMLSDYFPPKKLGRAASLYISSNYLGGSVAFVGGGLLIGWLNGVAVTDPGALRGFAPWQMAILLAALPGFLLVPCYFFLLREPPRRGQSGKPPKIGFGELLRELGDRRKFLALICVGMAAAACVPNATASWLPALFIRVYGWTATEVGLALGTLTIFSGVLGSYAGGWLTDWLSARGRAQAPIEVAAFSFIGVGVLGATMPLLPSGELAFACYVPMAFLLPMAFSCAPTAIQLVTPGHLRARVSGIYFTSLGIVGLGVGPILVGFMTDRLFTAPTDVRYSLSIVIAVAVPIMVCLMLLARRPYRELIEAMD